jgi:hypothetical protein
MSKSSERARAVIDTNVACALGGEADYLVTNAPDLLTLAGDPRLGTLRMVTAAEFVGLLDIG